MPSVKETLEGYVAGRVKAERVVAAVTAAYYGERGAASRERWRPLMDVLERAHPGVVELAGTTDRPGFAVRIAERPFPKAYEAALREAVQVALGNVDAPAPRSALPAPGIWARIYTAVRKLFTAST